MLAVAVVMPVLVTGIQRAASSGALGRLDPGHKARDDRWGGLGDG
jgi:hypothetical protein